MGIQPAENANTLPEISEMTDREILVEVLVKMRQLEEALTSLQDSPIVSAIMSGQNPLIAMMGR